jgi:hypothetical protein
MLDKEKKVQGIAVYAEFRKPGEIMQIIVTPDAYTTSGSLIPMTLVRRTTTKLSPKKQWKLTSFRENLSEMVAKGEKVADSDKEAFTENRMRYATAYFDAILNQGWTIEKSPILLETSRHDADDLAKGKTPNKLLYRAHISRKALGFSEMYA